MNSLLISGGTIVNEGRKFLGYILVLNGVIAEVGEGEHPCADRLPESVRRIDASGKIVMPGVIDCHVHFREPGLEWKGDMATESAAAVAGGVTSVLEMPNTIPQTTSLEAVYAKMKLAEGRMHTNYAFFVGATSGNLGVTNFGAESFGAAKKHQKFTFSGEKGVAIAGVKLFMGSSTGGMLVEDDYTLSKLFAEFDGVISAHCEDEAVIRTNTELYRARLGDTATAAIHPLVRSEEACYRATARAVELADRYGARLHVAHLTTERELSLFDAKKLWKPTVFAENYTNSYGIPAAEKRISDSEKRFSDIPDIEKHISGISDIEGIPAIEKQISIAEKRISGISSIPVAEKRITAEACVPHLWFTYGDYSRLGNRIKCNPAIKTAADRDALRNALNTNKIDVVATDHAPHTAEEKSRPYWDAPSGIPSVQHSLPLMFTLVSQGVLTLETLVEKMCHAPAVRFGIARRGFLRPGYYADIVIVDPAAKADECEMQGIFAGAESSYISDSCVSDDYGWMVSPANILYKCGWSPWEDTRFTARITHTIINGYIVWNAWDHDDLLFTADPDAERKTLSDVRNRNDTLFDTAKGRPLEFK